MTRMGRVRASRASALGALALTGLLAACATPTEPMPSPSPGYTSTYETPPPIAVAPLTGELVEPGSLTAPSLAAKVDNHPNARPQQGLEHTDLVFEELVEGGLTRYVAVWHSDVPAEIGPIRSIRPMDPDIVSPLGGIIAYSGGQYRFVNLTAGTSYVVCEQQPAGVGGAEVVQARCQLLLAALLLNHVEDARDAQRLT